MKYLGRALIIIIIISLIQSCNCNELKIKSSVYTKSCPEGEFVIQKLSSGMKIPRYRFLINQSKSLQNLLQCKVKSKWYKLNDADFEVDFPRISKQNSYIMVYKALQQYSASVHVLIKNTCGKLRRDLISIRNELRKVMCSVEGLLNGMHAEEIKYKFISQKDMDTWLLDTFNSTLSPLAISREFVKNLIVFNEIILDLATQRLETLMKNERRTKLPSL